MNPNSTEINSNNSVGKTNTILDAQNSPTPDADGVSQNHIKDECTAGSTPALLCNSLSGARFVSGFGQFHTNRYGQSFVPISLDEIRYMVTNPQQVIKQEARWFIPSTLQTRVFTEQEARGQFWALWVDLDKDPQPLSVVTEIVTTMLPGINFEAYLTSSATPDRPKSRLILPLEIPLSGNDWMNSQECLSELLADTGLIPDRAAHRPGQLCYLPNRGAYYDAMAIRHGVNLNPIECFARGLDEKAQMAAILEEKRQIAVQESLERVTVQADPNGSLIHVFNNTHSVEDVLEFAGYARRGSHWRHPNSESGSYSASVRNGRVFSLSASDPLWTGGAGGHAHDAFSAFAAIYHNNNLVLASRHVQQNLRNKK